MKPRPTDDAVEEVGRAGAAATFVTAEADGVAAPVTGRGAARLRSTDEDAEATADAATAGPLSALADAGMGAIDAAEDGAGGASDSTAPIGAEALAGTAAPRETSTP